VGRRLIAAGLVVALAGIAGAARSGLDRRARSASPVEELLYLPSGKHLRLMSLGHPTLLADVLYLWAIQYYSDYERGDRQRWVRHVFDDVITELDPRYVDAYWMGALILVLEFQDVDAGVALLAKGTDRNPEEWILPYLAAWECYHAGRLDQATAFFERASRVPGAPTAVRRMRASIVAQQGDLEDALATWSSILEDPQSDARSVRIATRKVRELRTRADVERLERAVEQFRIDNGRRPATLEDLVAQSYVRSLPRDPDDHAYHYDVSTGRVFSPAGRALGGD
jgi:tetratricopeptide (TPR) repeat protein